MLRFSRGLVMEAEFQIEHCVTLKSRLGTLEQMFGLFPFPNVI